jgi:hypothetical protein
MLTPIVGEMAGKRLRRILIFIDRAVQSSKNSRGMKILEDASSYHGC